MAYRRTLVPLDGSDLARSALPLALSLSRLFDGGVTLVSVVADGDEQAAAEGVEGSGRGAVVATSTERARAPAGTYLAAVADEAREAGGQIDDTLVVPGDPATEIVAAARDRDMDLVVIATRGRSGLFRGLLGSVTDRVIHSSSIPVLVVPALAEPAAPADWLPKNVIVPLDGSELAEAGLAHADALCAAANARLTLLRAVSFPAMYATDPYGGAPAAAFGLVEAEQQEARRYLEGVAGRVSSLHCEPGIRVATGHPRGEIVALAEELPDAIVVMTTRGTTGLTRWVVGSVADTVVRSSPVPVLVIPPRIGL